MGGYDSFLEDFWGDFLGTSLLEPQKCVCDLSLPSWEVIDTVPGRWQKGQTTSGLNVPGSINSHYFHIIGDKLINPIVGVYIPIINIIRIPIKGGMTIPNIATFDHGTNAFCKICEPINMCFVLMVATILDKFGTTFCYVDVLFNGL